jgi:NTP pyrophosphatase (non-canonical NTP hydrolase)
MKQFSTRTEVLNTAIKTYGMFAQMDMCIEECSELIKALLKYRRNEDKQALANICEEMADVQIMLDQMRLVFGETIEQEQYKIKRLAERLGYDYKIAGE